MKQINDYLVDKLEKKSGPKSERAYWIQEIADFTGMKWIVIFGKTTHLPTAWIKWLYEDSKDAKDLDSQRKKFWYLLKQTKPNEGNKKVRNV